MNLNSSMKRRGFLGILGALGLTTLITPSAEAHHKPGHMRGPPESSADIYTTDYSW
jgi:hypothetical protein